MSYFYFGILVISAVLLVRVIPFDRFKIIFCNIIFVLSIISVLVYLIYTLIPSIIGFSFIGDNSNTFENVMFVAFHAIHNNRTQSIFWEPGVFASFLLIALAFELLFSSKTKISHVIVYLVALVFTFSTAGYLLTILVLVPAIIDRVKHEKLKSALQLSFIPVFFGAILIVFLFSGDLAKYLPDVFSKIAQKENSFTSRLYSPKINIDIFLQKPFFGWGIHGANAKYVEIATSGEYTNLIDAQTTTSVSLLARFGIFGAIFTLMLIAGIVLYDKAGHLSVVSFMLLMLIIVNKEPHSNMLLSWAIPFYFVYETFDAKILARRKKKEVESDDRTLMTILKQDNHTGVVARNTLLSFGLKGVALLIGLFTIPVYSQYFNNDSTYGIWLTFLSIITWVMTFDLGFGNGMKNKLIEALNKGEKEEGKRIVSSTYSFSFVIGAIILSVGLIVINLLDPVKIFNFDPDSISASTVRLAFCITFATIAVEFVLKNICHVFQSHQKHFLSNLLPLLANTGLLLFALIARFNDVSQKLLFLSIAYATITVLPYILASLIAFIGPMKEIRPSFKYSSFKKGKTIMSLGLMFFLIQMALLFLNSADQIIISSIFSSENVVEYTKYSKFFNVILSIANIYNGIMWTSACKSIASGNNHQLTKGIKSLFIFDIVICFLCLLVAFFMQPLLDVWLGEDSFTINFFIVLMLLIFTIENLFVSSTGSLLNSFQCLLPQAISIAAAAALKIGLVFLIHAIDETVTWNIIYTINVVVWIPLLVVNFSFLIKKYRQQIRKAKENDEK
ncbi:MAG: O-antigen ligase family protein [Bacilli bacterium]|nr:O-antigen ligase family protein [Bacilli bacterium]